MSVLPSTGPRNLANGLIFAKFEIYLSFYLVFPKKMSINTKNKYLGI